MSTRTLCYYFLTLTAFGLIACTSNTDVILRGLSETQANELVVALDSQGILAEKLLDKSDKKKAQFSLLVASKDKLKALRVLRYNFLPATKSQDFKDIYSPDTQGLIPSQQHEQARFQMALQGEIENMLLILPGIVKAKVTLVLPKNPPFANHEQPKQPSASVAIVYNPIEQSHNPLSAPDIQALVAAAVLGLAPQHVAVLLKENRPPILVQEKGDEPKINPTQETTTIINADQRMSQQLNRSRKLNLFFVFLILASALMTYAQLRRSNASQ